MANDKVTSGLTETASKADPTDCLEVVVELQQAPPASPSPASRQEKMAALRSGFEQQCDALKSKIASLGGTVTGQAWLNSTLSVRLPKSALDAIAGDSAVKRIDVPHALQKE
jgi:hypothetical protein